jgi:hypothetical protein
MSMTSEVGGGSPSSSSIVSASRLSHPKMTKLCSPAVQAWDEAVSFASWDMLWYTRGFRSVDNDRSRRHATKALTYPLTIASVLHEHSPHSVRNQRITSDGARSLAGKYHFDNPFGTTFDVIASFSSAEQPTYHCERWTLSSGKGREASNPHFRSWRTLGVKSPFRSLAADLLPLPLLSLPYLFNRPTGVHAEQRQVPFRTTISNFVHEVHSPN